MSLYSQNNPYGQPFSAHFSQPGIVYSYQQPPLPAPVFHIDPNSFRRDYSLRLAELTINSRPIIQNLSMLAQEFTRFAEIVAQCIEAHIRRVPPWMKLPAFYLLDAISKNVFEPYARHFATFVIPLFLETYEQVDQNTRSKMEEMLLTWRTGAPTGKELFGVVPQVAIERGVWGGEPNRGDSSNGSYSGAGPISKSQVLSELEFTLGQKERALQANPYDTVSQNHVIVLQQLRKLVEAGVSQEELQQILNQLRAFGRTVAPPAPPIVPHPHIPPTSHTFASQSSSYPALNSQPSFPPTQPSHGQPSAYHYTNYNQPKTESAESLTSPSISITEPSTTATISNLFDALVKAGVVSTSGTPTGAGDTAKEEETKAHPVDVDRESSRAYRRSILTQSIALTSADITKRQPRISHFLYDQLPVQCKQCGLRFGDNLLGKKRMNDHLDMHFRQNRKANQNMGRGHSRSWFVGVEDWIHDISTDVKGKGLTDGYRRLNAKAAAAAEVAKREAELRAQFVVVPPGDEAKAISCPICKETLKSEFLEDDEDWVWKNAVMKEDRVYHATCHAEAVASTNSLAARLRTELAQRSRSGTPEAHSLRSTPPRNAATSTLKLEIKSHSPSPTGIKRKIENDTVLSEETDGIPPLKKVALSA